MTTRGLQPSEWGGEFEFVDVSAKTQVGLQDLLDTLLVVAELEELKANRNSAPASGVVVESKLDPGRGPVVTILIQRGTLRIGDALVAGANWGRVRAMHDFTGKRVKEAPRAIRSRRSASTASPRPASTSARSRTTAAPARSRTSASSASSRSSTPAARAASARWRTSSRTSRRAS